MKKIYIVEGLDEHGIFEVVSVWDNEDLAALEIDRLNQMDSRYYTQFEPRVIELNKPFFNF